jgi:hypothetical protein
LSRLLSQTKNWATERKKEGFRLKGEKGNSRSDNTNEEGGKHVMSFSGKRGNKQHLTRQHKKEEIL